MTSPWRPWQKDIVKPDDQQFRYAAAVVREVQKAEHRWFAQGDPLSDYLPWMPFQPAEFMAIMFDCVEQMNGRQFLDVGCGPGTKMQLARHFYGLDVCGMEIDEDMAVAAEVHGPVRHGDALDAPEGAFSGFDLIWIYRPFRRIPLERKLEARIHREMKPGAIIAGGQWEICPADLGWIPVVDDWELHRGAWRKPRVIEDVELPGLCWALSSHGCVSGAGLSGRHARGYPRRVRQELPRYRLGLVLDHLVLRRVRHCRGDRADLQHPGHALLAVLGPGADRLQAPV